MSEEDIGNPHGDEESEDGSLALKIKHYIRMKIGFYVREKICHMY